jgi:hypothetical protein
VVASRAGLLVRTVIIATTTRPSREGDGPRSRKWPAVSAGHWPRPTGRVDPRRGLGRMSRNGGGLEAQGLGKRADRTSGRNWPRKPIVGSSLGCSFLLPISRITYSLYKTGSPAKPIRGDSEAIQVPSVDHE